MKTTIADIDLEAKYLLHTRLSSLTEDLRLIEERRYCSVQRRFKLIQDVLDQKGITTAIVSRRESHKKHIYRYDVQVNFEVVKHCSYRNAAKMYIFKLYLKHYHENSDKEEKH